MVYKRISANNGNVTANCRVIDDLVFDIALGITNSQLVGDITLGGLFKKNNNGLKNQQKLMQQALGLQLKQIEAQNKLANAETAKTLAEANKIAGVDTEGAKLNNEWKKIENRIQISRENIEASNVTAAEANAQKAVAEWNRINNQWRSRTTRRSIQKKQ